MPKSNAASSMPTELVGDVLRPHSGPRGLLSEVIIDLGPRDILGRLFLKADTALRARGIRVGFVDFEELVEINAANSDSWRPLLPVFDPSASDISADNGFAVVGRNARGEPVSAHAFRLIRLNGRPLKDELESLRIFYADPARMKWPGESLTVTARSAFVARDIAVFSGAAWLRPDYRGKGLLTFIQPLVRAISFTRWAPDFVFSFMAPGVIKGGVAESARFTSVEWEVTLVNTPVLRGDTIHAALVSTDAASQLVHFAEFVSAADERDRPGLSATASLGS